MLYMLKHSVQILFFYDNGSFAALLNVKIIAKQMFNFAQMISNEVFTTRT